MENKKNIVRTRCDGIVAIADQLAELIDGDSGQLLGQLGFVKHLIRRLSLRDALKLIFGNVKLRTRLTNCASKEKSRAHSMQCSICEGKDFSVQNGTSVVW